MGYRVLDGTPRFAFATDRGRYELWVPAKGLVLERITGHATGDLVRSMIVDLEKLLAETSPISFFDDFEEVESYESAARQHITTWTKENWAKIRAVHVLVRSRAVATAVSVANVALGGAMRSYTERPRFEAAFKLELDQALAPPRKA